MYNPETLHYWEVVLGPDLHNGHVQHYTAPAGAWVGFRLLEDVDYCLLCEVVAPGFDLSGLKFVTQGMLNSIGDKAIAAKLANVLAPNTHQDESKEVLFDQSY